MCPEQGQFHHWFENGSSFIASMTDTKGTVFVAECAESSVEIRWFFSFKTSVEEEEDDDGNTRIDDRARIVEQVVNRTDGWHSCFETIRSRYGGESSRASLVSSLIRPNSRRFESVECSGTLDSCHSVGRCLSSHCIASYALVGGGSNALADGVTVAQSLWNNHTTAIGPTLLRSYEQPVRKRSIPQAVKSKRNGSEDTWRSSPSSSCPSFCGGWANRHDIFEIR